MPVAGSTGIRYGREDGRFHSASMSKACAEVTREKSLKGCALKRCISIFSSVLNTCSGGGLLGTI